MPHAPQSRLAGEPQGPTREAGLAQRASEHSEDYRGGSEQGSEGHAASEARPERASAVSSDAPQAQKEAHTMRYSIHECQAAPRSERTSGAAAYPKAGALLAIVEADSLLGALDAYSEQEDFAPYSATEMAEQVCEWANGVATAPFTNMEILAFPLRATIGQAGYGVASPYGGDFLSDAYETPEAAERAAFLTLNNGRCEHGPVANLCTHEDCINAAGRDAAERAAVAGPSFQPADGARAFQQGAGGEAEEAERWRASQEPRCTCEWADDGDGESGPSPHIAEADEACPQHGRAAEPLQWAEDDAIEAGYLAASVQQGLAGSGLIADADPDLLKQLHEQALVGVQNEPEWQEDDGHDFDRASGRVADALKALYGFGAARASAGDLAAAAETIETFAGIDEGEHTDYDELLALASRLRAAAKEAN